MWEKASKSWDRILEGMGFITGVFMVLMMLLVTSSVFLRYVMNRPIEGSEEVSGYIMLYGTFLGAAWLMKRDGHVRVGFIVDAFSTKARVLTYFVTTFVSFLMSLLLFQQSLAAAVDYYRRGTVLFYSVMRMPIHLLYWPIVLGSFLLGIECARQVWTYWRTSRQGKL